MTESSEVGSYADTGAYEHAFDKVTIGNVELRNRIFSSAHQTGLVHDHLPTDELLAYHGERARGGIGAIFLEASAVHPSGLLTPHTIGAYLPGVVPPLARIADAVHQEGTKLFVQLFHGGREQIAAAPKAPALAPSSVPSQRFHVEPRALTTSEIDELIEGYAQSAAHMAQAGLDGVEISASHAYLPAQFFSKRSNRRDDAYGGDLRGRLKFVTEVVSAVRSRLPPEKAVGLRLALDEISADALDREACVEIAAILATETPIDFLSFVLGDSATYVGSSFIAPRPMTIPAGIVAGLNGVRERLPETVKMLATTRVLELNQAHAAIADGLTDLVGMTRAHIADPHLIRKATAGARPIPCIACNVCIGHYHAGLPIACVTNVSTGREKYRRQPTDEVVPSQSGSIAIVGAGPAGVAAAVEAARNGRAVTLFEKEAEIGGQLNVAGAAPDHRETWQRWKTWAKRELANFHVDVRLNSEWTGSDSSGFDQVLFATGAEPFRDADIWNAAQARDLQLIDTWQVLRAPEQFSGTILVADWGGDPSGLDAAEVLASQGCTVYYSYAAPSPAEQVHQYQRNGYLGRLDSYGVTLLPHVELVAEDEQLVLRNVFSGRVRALPDDVDTVVAAHGRIPNVAGLDGLERVALIGDAAAPRSLEEATLEGAMAFEIEPAP